MTDEQKDAKPGCLYICGTPIGNLEDITLRALKVLQNVDYIAAEDTRQTLKLLNHYDIHKTLISCHEHNERQRAGEIVDLISKGCSVALVTDAGMPVTSDPGSVVVEAAHEAGLPVSVVPGPTAVSAALAISGFGGDRYVFEGFLPRGKKERRSHLEALRYERQTVVLYEAPHRLLTTLGDLLAWLGDRPMAVAREITKIHEQVIRGTIGEMIAHFEDTQPRGEFVLVLKGYEGAAVQDADEGMTVEQRISAYMRSGMSKKDAIKQVAADTGLPKNEVYKKALHL
jgi:16S rRNA (cytidine1402-2'-O)-methyltransferase